MPVLSRTYGLQPSEVRDLSDDELDAYFDDAEKVSREQKQRAEKAKRGR